MALPRRCKKCRCYVAPQLSHCPRCKTKAAPMVAVVKLSKEDRAMERSKRDEKLPTVHAKNIHWIPSAFAIAAHEAMVPELRRRLHDADTPALRNTIRSELRLTKALLDRRTVPSGKHAWTTETFHTKQGSISVFISPKKHRYVLATRDGPADLIYVSRKKHARSIPYSRLLRWEQSPYARMKKAEKQEEVIHKKRKKAKKERRLKRKQKPTLV